MKFKLLIVTYLFSLLSLNAQVSFSVPQKLSNEDLQITDIRAADMDQDQDCDYVFVGKEYFGDPAKVFLVESVENDFFISHILTDQVYNYASTIEIVDLNNDNLPDIIYQDWYRIAWLKNLGSSSFSDPIIIFEETNQIDDFSCIDINNDGNIDVVLAGKFIDYIALLVNDGDENFGEVILVSDLEFGITSITVGDIDNDNDFDLIAAASYDNYNILCYKNEGNENFGNPVIVYDGFLANSYMIKVSDFDSDNDLDVMATCYNESTVVWFENDGSGNTFIDHVIFENNSVTISYGLPGDLNGDLFPDVNLRIDHDLVYFVNDGTGNFGTPAMISSGTKDDHIFNYDVNYDGKLDVLSTKLYSNTSDITAIINIDQGVTFDRSVILAGILAGKFSIQDFNNDGERDIATINGSLAWYKNRGNKTFCNPKIISKTIDVGSTDFNSEIITGDFDGDTDSDIIAMGKAGSIELFLNDGFGSFADSIIISQALGFGTCRLDAADFDNDDDLDFIFVNGYPYPSGSKVILFKNDGSGNFSQQYIVSYSSPLTGRIEIHSNDLDNDNDIDFVYGVYSIPYDDKLYWAENDGDGNFTSHLIVDEFEYPKNLFIADIDNDLDNDIFMTSQGSILKWLKNDGSNNFWEEIVLDDLEDDSYSFDYIDIDLDDDVDIVFSSASKLFYYLNNGNGIFNAFERPTQHGSIYLRTEDIDNDTDVDVIIASTDLIYHLNNTVNVTEYAYLCEGDSVFVNDLWYNESGVYYYDTLQNYIGGDSIIAIQVLDQEYLVYPQNETICNWDSVLWRNEFYNYTGTFYDTTFVSVGCDSVFILDLATQYYYFEEYSTFCTGDSLLWHSNYYFESGVYYDSLQTINGCDSIFLLELEEKSDFYLLDEENICEGDSLLWQSEYYLIEGIYYDSLLTIDGCDSVLSLNLEVFESHYFTENELICEGDSVLWRSNYYFAQGIYFDSLNTANGCDSIYSLNIDIAENFYFIDQDSICPGDSVYWRSNYYHSAGIYWDSLFTTFGCDSTYQLNLALHQLPPVFNIEGETYVYKDSLEFYFATDNPEVTYTWNVGNGLIVNQPGNNQIEVLWQEAGQGFVHAISENLFGCLSDTTSLEITIDINTGIIPNDQSGIIIYPNPANENIYIISNGIVLVEIFDLTGYQIISSRSKQVNVSAFQNGIYLVLIKNDNGSILKIEKLLIQ